jgi:hypothetical protein
MKDRHTCITYNRMNTTTYRGICRTASPKLCLPPQKNLSLAKIIAPPLDRISNNLEKLLTCPPSDLSLAKIIVPPGGAVRQIPLYHIICSF